MADPVPFPERLRKGLLRTDGPPPSGDDADILPALRRSLERTLVRTEAGSETTPALFRFQLTGGRPLLYQGSEALPIEPTRLRQLLNSMDCELLSGESLDVDGELAAWLIRSEVNLTDSNLRRAEESIRGMKTGRDRDHAASQSADSAKIRLRSRLSQLVSALQAAQRDTPTPG